MTVVETHIGGRRAAARDAAETRKKIILAVLAVVLLALLAFQLPKIMTSSSSSSSTASTALVTPASPVVTGGGGEPVPAADAKRLRLIRQLEVKDPFVPLIHASTTTSSSAPTAAKAASAARTRQSKRPVAKPVPFTPAAPTGAVIWTNGQRQVVGLHQVFNIGDAQFRLLAVTQKAMRIEAVDGAFGGKKKAIEVRKGHRIDLANTATGVQYRLLFARGTTEAPIATQAATPSSTESVNPNAATGS